MKKNEKTRAATSPCEPSKTLQVFIFIYLPSHLLTLKLLGSPDRWRGGPSGPAPAVPATDGSVLVDGDVELALPSMGWYRGGA